MAKYFQPDIIPCVLCGTEARSDLMDTCKTGWRDNVFLLCVKCLAPVAIHDPEENLTMPITTWEDGLVS